MRKSPIKVKLARGTILGGEEGYRITQITGAITIGSYDGKLLRAGDLINEKQAEKLTMSYLVTVGMA